MQPSNRSKRTLWLVVAGIAIIVLGTLGYIYRTRVRLGLDVLVDETGSRTMAVLCVVLSLLVLCCLLLWMVFPLLVYLGLKDLRRRTSELDETTRACARHLAAMAEECDRPKEKEVRNE
jgi:hypothetical protein